MQIPSYEAIAGLSPDFDLFERLLRRLQGRGGYSEDTSSLRDLELQVVARAVATASAKIDEAGAQAFPQTLDILLEEWEAELRIPSDAARTTAERRDRIVAVLRAQAGADADNVATVLDLLAGVSATVATPTRAEVAYDGDAAVTVHTLATLLDSTDYADQGVRRAIADALARVVPAAAIGQDLRPDPVHSMYTTEGTTFGSSDLEGQTVIAREPTISQYGMRTPLAPARFLDYGPLSVLRAEDLSRLESELCMRAASDTEQGTNGGSPEWGQQVYYFQQAVASGGTYVADSSIDWRDRFVLGAAVWSDVDIRPGQANDSTWRTRSKQVAGWYTGSGGTGYELTLDSNLYLFVDASNGNLRISNSTGGTRYVCGLVIGSPVWAERGGTCNTDIPGAPSPGGDFSGTDTAWIQALLERNGTVHAPSVNAPASWPGDGGVHRVAAVVGLGPGDGKWIDSSIDWRDRVILVHSAGLATWSSGFVVPGIPSANMVDRGAVIGYTRSGAPSASEASPHGTDLELGSQYLRLYADYDTGALRIYRSSSDTETEDGSYVLMITASEQLGEYGTPDTLPTLYVGDGFTAQVLNSAQDYGLVEQVRASISDPTAQQSEAMHLGPRHWGGNPPIPAPEVITAEPGDSLASVGTVTVDRRQRIAGAARIMFSRTVSNGANLQLDDTFDWRDRVVAVWGTYSTSDIRPGQAADNSGAGWQDRCNYVGHGGLSGPVFDLATNVRLYVDDSTGALRVDNQSGTSYYIVGCVWASGQITGRV